ncbi:hypothetical protein BJ878DRAFT_541795 [Calycina marina]|uniref:Uncharacterized protein n=1 Tax=Calycina marina TaxID=1763456 RepID=A0A9P7Z451_9HELO|nr:hypothetical protein BJ878DRAFT_541795 [Calycina marina]
MADNNDGIEGLQQMIGKATLGPNIPAGRPRNGIGFHDINSFQPGAPMANNFVPINICGPVGAQQFGGNTKFQSAPFANPAQATGNQHGRRTPMPAMSLPCQYVQMTPQVRPSPTTRVTIEDINVLVKTIPTLSFPTYRSETSQPPYKSIGRIRQDPPLLDETLPMSCNFIRRADQSSKDLVISANSVVFNRQRVCVNYDANGQIMFHNTNEFDPDKHDLINTLSHMSENDKENLWEKTWINIIVDYGVDLETITEPVQGAPFSITRLQNSIVETLRYFDEETGIYDYAKTIFFTIVCPHRNDRHVNFRASKFAQQHTPEFREIVDLAREMNGFKNIEKLEVILHNLPED